MSTAVLVICIMVMLAGIAGTAIPIIPGVPLVFIAIFAYGYYEGFQNVNSTYLLIMGALTFISVLADYLSSYLGARHFGSSKKGQIGAIIGAVLGIFVLPPAGILAGPFIGAVIGEIIDGKEGLRAMYTGLGAAIGVFSGILIKLLIAIIMFLSFLLIIL